MSDIYSCWCDTWAMSHTLVSSARFVALTCVGALVLVACSGVGEPLNVFSAVTAKSSATPTSVFVADSLASPEPTEPPDDNRSPDPEGGVRPGDPVTPEFFISEIDEGANEYLAVIYVRGIFEDGGECSVTVVGSEGSHTKVNLGEADATGTACGSFRFPLNGLGVGYASVTSQYESADHRGESAEIEVLLP